MFEMFCTEFMVWINSFGEVQTNSCKSIVCFRAVSINPSFSSDAEIRTLIDFKLSYSYNFTVKSLCTR